MNIVVKESPSKKIIISHGEDDIKESEFIEGRISSLQLSADGKQAVYVTDNQRIQLLNTITGITEPILELDKPIQFVKIINLHNCNMVLCKWEENNLKVCLLNSELESNCNPLLNKYFTTELFDIPKIIYLNLLISNKFKCFN